MTKPKFNKDETEMELGGKKYVFKPTRLPSCRDCSLFSETEWCQLYARECDFSSRKCGRSNRLDKRHGIWREAPSNTAALSLSQIAALLQGEPVKTCLGTLTLKKE